MPPRERKRPKAVRAWAHDMRPLGAYALEPHKCGRFTQRVLIVPLGGKVLCDELSPDACSEFHVVLHDLEVSISLSCGKRIRVLVLEETP